MADIKVPAVLTEPADAWTMLAGQWRRSLTARNVSGRTTELYLVSLGRLAGHSRAAGIAGPDDITKTDVEGYFAARAGASTARGKKVSPSGLLMDFGHLKVFFTWWADTEEVPNPMRKIARPIVPEKPVPIIPTDELRALLAVCKPPAVPEGKTLDKDQRDRLAFTARRDVAIIRVLFDTGVRRAELAGMTLDDLDLDQQHITVHGKGRRTRTVAYGAKTAEALDRYLRLRAKHKDRALPDLWLAEPGHHKGPLGYPGIGLMLRRRAREAGVSGNLYPHRFRHTAADSQLEAGMEEGDVMRLFGWRTRSMLDRYGAERQERRALAAARRTNHADKL